MAPVYHIYLAGISVGEDEEGMAEEVHLERGLLGVHRLHLELLGAYDTRLYLFLVLHDNRPGLCFLVSLSLPMPAVELAPSVAPDLSLELVRHTVYRGVHVRRGLPGLQYRAVDKEGRVGNFGLGIRGVAFVDQLHLRPRDTVLL